MIQVQNLKKDFGPIRAVDDVSFEIEKGTILACLGPNGAGKTTTIRMMAGYLSPTAGTAIVNGVDVVQNPTGAQKHIGYMPENTPLYTDMTVTEFLSFVAEIRGFGGAEKGKQVDRVIEKCFLQPVRHRSIDQLSKGFRQRTCLAQTLIHDPPVLLLDEPTEGLDPNQKKIVRDMMREMADEKVIMLSTHVLEEVEAICSRVIIISAGKMVADSTPRDLKHRSPSFNAVTLDIVAPSEEAQQAFGGIGDVDRVEVLDAGSEKQRLRLYPKNQQALAAQAMDVARDRKWMITDMSTDGGRLDEVFRDLTTTQEN